MATNNVYIVYDETGGECGRFDSRSHGERYARELVRQGTRVAELRALLLDFGAPPHDVETSLATYSADPEERLFPSGTPRRGRPSVLAERLAS